MKVILFKCDRCGEKVPEDDVTKVTFSHGRGRFDLRDEEFDLCPVCDEVATLWVQNKEPT